MKANQYVLRVTLDPSNLGEPMDIEYDTREELAACIEGLTLGMQHGKRIRKLEAVKPSITEIVVTGREPQEKD